MPTIQIEPNTVDGIENKNIIVENSLKIPIELNVQSAVINDDKFLYIEVMEKDADT